MRLSELVNVLENWRRLHGDIPVRMGRHDGAEPKVELGHNRGGPPVAVLRRRDPGE